MASFERKEVWSSTSGSGSVATSNSTLVVLSGDPVETSRDTDDARKLFDEPERWRIALHPAAPADGVQKSPLVVLVGEQVDRFEQRRFSSVVHANDEIDSTRGVKREAVDAAVALDPDGRKPRLRDFVEGLPRQPEAGARRLPLAGQHHALEPADELLDSVEFAGLQFSDPSVELLDASVARLERAVDFTPDQ